MKRILTGIFIAVLALPSFAGTTTTYTYDAQHRLVQASYPADTGKVFYSYDAAGNVDLVTAITDSQYFRSFLHWLSWVTPFPWLPSARSGASTAKSGTSAAKT